MRLTYYSAFGGISFASGGKGANRREREGISVVMRKCITACFVAFEYFGYNTVSDALPTYYTPRYRRKAGNMGLRAKLARMMRRNDDGGAEAEEAEEPAISTLYSKAQHEKNLKRAYEEGILSKEDYLSKMHEHRGDCEGGLAAPVGTKVQTDGTIVPYNRYTILWEYAAGPFPSVKEAMAASHTVTCEANPEGCWKWNTKDAGGCKQHKRCNMHEDCPVLLRAHALGPDEVNLQVLNLAHGLEEKLYRDKNSVFTMAQEKEVKQSIEEGSRPSKIHDRHTMEAVKAGKRKNPKGGMEGERLEPMLSTASPLAGVVRCACIFWGSCSGRNLWCIQCI